MIRFLNRPSLKHPPTSKSADCSSPLHPRDFMLSLSLSLSPFSLTPFLPRSLRISISSFFSPLTVDLTGPTRIYEGVQNRTSVHTKQELKEDEGQDEGSLRRTKNASIRWTGLTL